jgi:hypothetical protein
MTHANNKADHELEGSMKTYHVEPFFPNLTNKQARQEGPSAVANQMQSVINRFAADGWSFERYDGVQTVVNSGCLGGTRTQQTYHMLVF